MVCIIWIVFITVKKPILDVVFLVLILCKNFMFILHAYSRNCKSQINIPNLYNNIYFFKRTRGTRNLKRLTGKGIVYKKIGIFS